MMTGEVRIFAEEVEKMRPKKRNEGGQQRIHSHLQAERQLIPTGELYLSS